MDNSFPASSVFIKQFLHTGCVRFRPWCARSGGVVMIMDVHLTIFEYCIIFWHATLSLRHPHTRWLNWWWVSVVETRFAHKKPHHTTNFVARRFHCCHHYMPCVGCYPRSCVTSYKLLQSQGTVPLEHASCGGFCMSNILFTFVALLCWNSCSTSQVIYI